MIAKGSFKVELEPMEPYNAGNGDITLGRMSIEKSYSGDLEAKGKGEMLHAMGSVQGAAGYVAIEQVVGTLLGKKGSFALQHYGRMQGQEQHLTIEVIPHSGSGELSGISGQMQIMVENGEHIFSFEYQFD